MKLTEFDIMQTSAVIRVVLSLRIHYWRTHTRIYERSINA